MAGPSTLTIAQPVARLADPHLTSDRRAILGIRWSIWETLVERAPDGAFRPLLATGWEIAPDARSWTFRLRNDVQFNDGSPLTSADVEASIRRMMDPARGGELGTSGVLAGYLAGLTIETPDRWTVRLMLGRPIADLLDLICDIAIVHEGPDGFAGSGPYVVDTASEGDIRLRRAADWWQGRPVPDRLRWVAVEDAGARARLLADGAVDLVADPPDGEPPAGATARSAPSGMVTAFLCNAFRGPCSDVRVRQALNLGLDVDQLTRAWAPPGSRRVNGPLTPIHFGWDPQTPAWDYEPAAARALLAEAGYRDGLDLTIDVPTTLPDEAPALAEALTRQLAAIGVRVTTRIFTERDAYANIVRAKQIDDACCFDSSPLSTWRVLNEKLHSVVAGPWWEGYENREVDGLLDLAAATVDPAERRRTYQRAYRLVRDDAPWIFLYEQPHRWWSREGVAWHPAPAGWIVPWKEQS